MITDKDREKLFGKQPKAFATIIPSRTTKPTVALHTSIGQAKNAITCQKFGTGQYIDGHYTHKVHEAEVYELKDGRWVLIYRVDDGTLETELPWRKTY